MNKCLVRWLFPVGRLCLRLGWTNAFHWVVWQQLILLHALPEVDDDYLDFYCP